MSIKTSQFVVDERWRLISQGAEARVWKIPQGTCEFIFECDAIAKERFSKSYRHPVLDERLTKQRCRAEARILAKCRDKGKMDVPAVLRVEPPVLYLEYLPGKPLRHILEDLLHESSSKSQEIVSVLAKEMGRIVGRLHNLGIVHGDLTTSNMMLKNDYRSIILIDFGLAKNTESAEERAVDLYVLERALSSTHPSLPDNFWKSTLAAYSAESNKADATLQRLEQVRQRGRKRECFG